MAVPAGTRRYKNCPFCGSDDIKSVFFNTEDPQYYAAVCNGCGAVGPKGAIMTNEDTIKWNCRWTHDMGPRAYAVIFQCKQAVSSYQNTVMTREGEEAVLQVEPEGWVPATATTFTGKLPRDIKVFDSEEKAHAFMKTWGGHPWYHIPNGKYRLVPIKPVYKDQLQGFEICV